MPVQPGARYGAGRAQARSDRKGGGPHHYGRCSRKHCEPGRQRGVHLLGPRQDFANEAPRKVFNFSAAVNSTNVLSLGQVWQRGTQIAFE